VLKFLHRVGDHLAVQRTVAAKGDRGGGGMGTEWIAVGILLFAGALFVGFPFGVAVGYEWRSRISRMRRLRYVAEQERLRAELDAGVTALARPDMRPATGEVAVASHNLSARAIAAETGIPNASLSRARKKATGSGDPIAKRSGKDGKRRKRPTESKVVTSDFLQEPGSDRASTEQQR
jgi:hypothetical protein